MDPIVVPRAQHHISRRDIDHDALRVLYRLRDFNHTAYLVGGSVRDLLLGRRPKDFDIGTSAHPYQVKRLFRNCWIIGRRFRLAHVKFGAKTIEVATFRRQVPAGTEEAPPASGHDPRGDRLVHRDNTFGTPEEDAFRRDFTVNALFYDIATFSIIDYVGGLEDIRARVIRSIGDPEERFREDPVRMLRAIALGARLGFQVDSSIYDAIARHRLEMAQSAPARLLEEYYKILRAGSSERTFRDLAGVGLLEHVTPQLHRGASETLWRSLADLDAYRRRLDQTPGTLTNAILLGSLVVPLGFAPETHGYRPGPEHVAGRPWEYRSERLFTLGALPIARKDVERLRQILLLQPRLHAVDEPPRARRAVMGRPAFQDALTWLEIHGHAPEAVQRWRELEHAPIVDAEPAEPAQPMPRSRRRRRRRRSRRRGPQT